MYIARAVDDRPAQEASATGELFAAALSRAGFTSIDPVLSFRIRRPPADGVGEVESDLRHLRDSDAVLADLSIPGWVYVGCICELVYAKLWGIPSVVIVGSSNIQARLWLRHHATSIVPDLDAGIAALRALLAPSTASGPSG